MRQFSSLLIPFLLNSVFHLVIADNYTVTQEKVVYVKQEEETQSNLDHPHR